MSVTEWERSLTPEQTSLLADLRHASRKVPDGWVTASNLARNYGHNLRSCGTKLAALERVGVVQSRGTDARLRLWRPKTAT